MQSNTNWSYSGVTVHRATSIVQKKWDINESDGGFNFRMIKSINEGDYWYNLLIFDKTMVENTIDLFEIKYKEIYNVNLPLLYCDIPIVLEKMFSININDVIFVEWIQQWWWHIWGYYSGDYRWSTVLCYSGSHWNWFDPKVSKLDINIEITDTM